MDRNGDGEGTLGATDMTTCFLDADGDGYGDGDITMVACTVVAPYVADSLDCDDLDATVHPDAVEDCSDVDRNCDGESTLGASDMTTFFLDADGDGYGGGDTAMDACPVVAPYVTD